MWPDNETEKDFLNFSGVADTVAEIIVQAQGRPISIGVSGAWGVGKSSMIKLIHKSLGDRAGKGEESRFVFVEFNAWLYQGYDDARAALLDVIANKLKEESEKRQTGIEKVQGLLSRVDWLRAAKLTAGSALAMSLGLPPIGLFGEMFAAGKNLTDGTIDSGDIKQAEDVAGKSGKEISGLIKSPIERSPPKEIQAIRNCFEEALEEMGIKLVVLIDDLDRCLPTTTISTLEAIRLFLFLKNTAFVIAADDAMIKHAVRQHFGNVDDNLVISYFDKLIQVPIRVPPLGTQEVRAYMMMLFIENSGLPPVEIESIRAQVCARLAETWKGHRVDRAYIESIQPGLSPEVISKLDTADRLAPLMTTASQVSGNPRLIKRFLNALSIRMAISKAHGVGVDEAALAKMLLFERCGDPRAYNALTQAVNNDAEGKARLLSAWEEKAEVGEALDLKEPWDDPFIKEWLTIPPKLADIDLRGILYVSREHAPLITPEDKLSSEAAELLAAILDQPDMASELKDRLTKLPRSETTVIMDRILDRARQEAEWGTPPILIAALAITSADPTQGSRLAGFLTNLPPAQVKPNIVVRIGDEPWAKNVFASWANSDVSPPVKAAITKQARKNGHV